MILLGLILDLFGTFTLLFAQPQFKYDEQLGSIIAGIKSEGKQKLLWRLGLILLFIGFLFQAIPPFIQWLCSSIST